MVIILILHIKVNSSILLSLKVERCLPPSTILSKMSLSKYFLDVAEPWQISFQDSGSPIHEGIIELHNTIFYYLLIILFGIISLFISIFYRFNESQFIYKYKSHGQYLELFWTITPAIILISISFPSFKLLYLTDEIISPTITIKVKGHQWYWTYEYCDFNNKEGTGYKLEYDSYVKPEKDLEKGEFRLLDVDNRVVIPEKTQIRFLVTSQDVIHDWAVPSLGIKMDAIPGRLNQISTKIEREGVYYGQCSELCGVAHYAMPIVVETVSCDKYISWLKEMYIKG